MSKKEDRISVVGSAAVTTSPTLSNKKKPVSPYHPSQSSPTKSFGTVTSDTNYYDSIYKMTSTPVGSYNNLHTSSSNNNNSIDTLSSSNVAKRTLSTSSPPSSSKNQSSNNSSSIRSQIEEAIIKSTSPIQTNETEKINVLGQKGVWLNKGEVEEWLSKNANQRVDLSEYKLNNDPNPEIIHKKSTARLEYNQDFTLRLLKPTTPEPPGDIIIKEGASVRAPPAPPLIIRQYPNVRAKTPQPLIIRERPPEAPPVLGKKLITISGKRLPPPPRKIIIERLAPLPVKPQSVLVERWLPFPRQKRKVIYQRAENDGTLTVPTRNTIVEWSAAEVDIKKRFKFAGVTRVNPDDYLQHYGADALLNENEMPLIAHEIKPPEHYVLASHLARHNLNLGIELEGDIEALKLVDLDKEGLGEYRHILNNRKNNNTVYKRNEQARMTRSPNSPPSSTEAPSAISLNTSSGRNNNNTSNVNSTQYQIMKTSPIEHNPLTSLASELSSAVTSLTNEALDELIYEIFSAIDTTSKGQIELIDAQKTLIRLNSCLDKKMDQHELEILFKKYFNDNKDEMVNFPSFRTAFLNISI